MFGLCQTVSCRLKMGSRWYMCQCWLYSEKTHAHCCVIRRSEYLTTEKLNHIHISFISISHMILYRNLIDQQAAKEAVAFGWHEKVDMEQFPANTTVEVLAGDGHTWMPATLVSSKVGSEDQEGYVIQYTTTGAVEQGDK